jgi:hypothetical protein
MSVTAEAETGLSPARRESVSAASSWRRDDYRRELAESLLSRRHVVPEMPEGERLVLADFESEGELLIFGDSSVPGGSARLTGRLKLDRTVFCHGSAAASFPVEGNLSSLKYPGVSSLPRDLSGWRWLRFEVYNPAMQAVWAELMMKDAPAQEYDARYNQTVVLDPGWNTVAVNLEASAAGRLDRSLREYGRAVDPSNVHHIVFSIPRERMPAELAGRGVVVDFFRLEERLVPPTDAAAPGISP